MNTRVVGWACYWSSESKKKIVVFGGGALNVENWWWFDRVPCLQCVYSSIFLFVKKVLHCFKESVKAFWARGNCESNEMCAHTMGRETFLKPFNSVQCCYLSLCIFLTSSEQNFTSTLPSQNTNCLQTVWYVSTPAQKVILNSLKDEQHFEHVGSMLSSRIFQLRGQTCFRVGRGTLNASPWIWYINRHYPSDIICCVEDKISLCKKNVGEREGPCVWVEDYCFSE